MAKPSTPLSRFKSAAVRWHNYHHEQLTEGKCSECTRLYKAIAAFTKTAKRK